VQAAFVRHSDAGLLLPRLIALGDAELEESSGLALDPLLGDAPLPPAIDPLRRRLILSRLILANYRALGLPLLAPASLQLADTLARVIDQLHFEEIDPRRLDTAAAGDLSRHWDVSMKHLQLLLEQWPAELARRGAVDLAARRNLMLGRLVQRWRAEPPPGFTIAAGISVTAPAVARLLRGIADLPGGMVVLPGLDRTMPDAEWEALGPARPDPLGPRPLDAHPQYQFKLLLDRMGVQRAEVQDWPVGAGDAPVPGRAALASALFIPSRFTADWCSRAPVDGAAGISVAEFPDDAAEARGIALLLRQALEQPGQTAALVTPDRQLAARVASSLSRWGIAADDSAGEPLGQSPPGALARLAMAAACGGGLVPLIGLLGHPLVRAGEGRGAWLRAVRALDLALRGPGMPQTPAAIALWLDAKAADPEQGARWQSLARWWHGAHPLLQRLWSLADGDAAPPPLAVIDALVELLDTLSGAGIWAGPAGRQLAALFDRWRMAAPDGPDRLPAATVARQLDELLAGEPVRAPFGRHPRLFIWGLLEARLQRADLMILGGLNEGGWPAAVNPDPWLAPGIRRQLGLASTERAQGLAAHDFVTALGAPQVVVTRARRQGQDPAIASRLWLRLQAIAGPLPPAMVAGEPLTALTARIDQQPGRPAFAERPLVAVHRADRPDRVAVTALDMLASDPFAFHARHILRLTPLDRLGEPVDARWRGVRVHALLEQWVKDGADPAAVDAALAELARDPALDPVDGAAWLARIGPAIRWAAAEMTANRAQGRRIVAAECKGEWTAEGITLTGKADRIDQTDAGLVVVDYKSGGAPKAGDLKGGKAMQLGLLAAMIESGAFADLPNIAPASAEYWLLRPDDAKTHAGHVHHPYSSNVRATINSFEQLCDLAYEGFVALRDRYLLGDAAFGAGDGHPDYDHLARRDEWVGRAFQGPAA
jgi:ATP-dependent helicase/nuclease subunit B